MWQNLMRTLDGKPPGKPVWTADLAYWLAGQQAKNLLPEKHQGETGFLELSRDLGVMPYYWYEKFWVARPVYDETVEIVGHKEGERTVTLFKTPVGELRAESVFLEESVTRAMTKHAVETRDDLKIMDYLIRHRKMHCHNLPDYHIRLKRWQEYGGIPALALPRSPLNEFVYQWAGLQNSAFLLFECDDLLHPIFEYMDEQMELVLEEVCKAEPLLIHFAENMSSDNFGGYFEPYLKSRYKHCIEKLTAAGIKTAIHLDGKIEPLLARFAETGFDAVEALTPSPFGDVSVAEMRKSCGSDKLTLWGGVPGAMFSGHSWEELENHVKHLLECWRGTPHVVGVADQVPPNGNIDYCRRITEMIQEIQ